jgi:hypothetical protein
MVPAGSRERKWSQARRRPAVQLSVADRIPFSIPVSTPTSIPAPTISVRPDAPAPESSGNRRRAERRRVKILAKLVLDADREESVLLADISDTGVRLRLPRLVSVTLDELLDASLLVRVEAGKDETMVRVNLELVRIASVTEQQVDLAFEFRDITPEIQGQLWHLRNLIFH